MGFVRLRLFRPNGLRQIRCMILFFLILFCTEAVQQCVINFRIIRLVALLLLLLLPSIYRTILTQYYLVAHIITKIVHYNPRIQHNTYELLLLLLLPLYLPLLPLYLPPIVPLPTTTTPILGAVLSLLLLPPTDPGSGGRVISGWEDGFIRCNDSRTLQQLWFIPGE